MRTALMILLMIGTAQARHIAKQTPISPSHASLVRQNLCVDQMGLTRIQDEAEMQRMVEAGTLIALPNDDAVTIAPSLPANRRYALSMTVDFLLTLSEAYRVKFGKRLTVDSAVRPRSVQERLRRTNRSAAPADGETASSHETGATIDLSKKLTGAQLKWLRNVLCMYQVTNVVVVEEERRCFHIEVIGETE
jgi:hypothetical protein